MEEPKKQPKYSLKIGAIELAIWKNKTKDNEEYTNYTWQRAYTKDDGKTYDHTHTLRTRDLLPLARLLEQAYMQEEIRTRIPDTK